MQGQESTIFIYLKTRTELRLENAPERFYCYKVPCVHNENSVTEKYNLSASPNRAQAEAMTSYLFSSQDATPGVLLLNPVQKQTLQ